MVLMMAVFVQYKSRMNKSLKRRTKDTHYIFFKIPVA